MKSKPSSKAQALIVQASATKTSENSSEDVFQQVCLCGSCFIVYFRGGGYEFVRSARLSSGIPQRIAPESSSYPKKTPDATRDSGFYLDSSPFVFRK